jgi:hypothetical protein
LIARHIMPHRIPHDAADRRGSVRDQLEDLERIPFLAKIVRRPCSVPRSNNAAPADAMRFSAGTEAIASAECG